MTGNIDGATLYNTIFENNIDGVVLNKNNSVTYCTFNSNDSTAINLKSQGNLIKNVTINNNHTGIMTGTGNSEFSNILVYGNNTGFRSNNTSLSLFNCTIASNEKGIHADGAGLAIQNSIIWDHKTQFELNNSSLTIVYSDISDGTNYSEWSSGEGNISLNPKFSNDYKLESGSPCINTGNPSSVYNDADGTRNDMGAFGGPEGNWWPHNF